MKRFHSFAVALSLFSSQVMVVYASPEMVVAKDGQTSAVICVAVKAAPPEPEGIKPKPGRKIVLPPGHYERKAAEDLARYIELMTGACPSIVDEPAAIKSALGSNAPIFVVGQLALESQPALARKLAGITPAKRIFDSDSIVLRRDNNKVYLAGSTELGHYYAVTTLLNKWGCRWYMPTEFGEVVPERPELTLGVLDTAYAPPFEMRNYWIAWNGSRAGGDDFMARNFYKAEKLATQHILSKYVKPIIPEGKSGFNVPITAPETAEQVVKAVEEKYAVGSFISLSMEDGVYSSGYQGDTEAVANIQDKYFQNISMTDPFMRLYKTVGETLQQRYPESKSTLAFLAYCNLTIPPQRDIKLPKNIVAEIAPIDIDPNHAVTDSRSPSREEYREMVLQWSEMMDKRITIYDYDQSSLVWRTVPNPSHQVMRKDIPFYRDAGAIGISTESRGDFATIFTNLYFRGQLMWNPDVDVDALMEEFYTGFYGVAAAPMKRYWGAIYKAWEETALTEHEFFMIPGIYTRELVEEIRKAMDEALATVAPLRAKPVDKLTRNERLVLDRVTFTKKSFDIIDHYTGMVRAGASDGDYAKAVAHGRAAIQARLELAEMSPIFTTGVINKAGGESSRNKKGELNAAWLVGEVEQYSEIGELMEGQKGKRVKLLPLEWAFRRDPNDTGLARGFARKPADLAFWEQNKAGFVTPEQKRNYPTTQWEVLRSDLYAQAQGVLHPDGQSFTGFLWYKTPVELTAAETQGHLRVHFPGIFSEAWLYVNGHLIAHRPQRHMWWKNNYLFNWDVDLAGRLKPGANDITLRVHNTHHNGGLFRRPFIYKAN